MARYRVLRTITGAQPIRRGEVIEDPDFRNLDSLINTGYLQLLPEPKAEGGQANDPKDPKKDDPKDPKDPKVDDPKDPKGDPKTTGFIPEGIQGQAPTKKNENNGKVNNNAK